MGLQSMSSPVSLGGEESGVCIEGPKHCRAFACAHIPAWSSHSIHCLSSQPHKVGIPAPIVQMKTPQLREAQQPDREHTACKARALLIPEPLSEPAASDQIPGSALKGCRCICQCWLSEFCSGPFPVAMAQYLRLDYL